MNSPQAKVMKEVISRMLSKFGYGADNLEVLAEYVTVMIINNKGLEQVNRELGELIGDDYDSTFASALFEELKGGGEPVGDENELSVQEMASTPTPVTDIHQPMTKMEEDSSIRHPIPAEKRVFTSTNARLFSSAIGGVLRDAANSSAAAEEMRQYLEGEEDRDVKLEEEIPTQPAAGVRRPRDYPSRTGNGTQSRSYHPNSKLKRAPVTSRLGDRMSPYMRPSNQTHGGGPMHRLGGGPGWGPGNGQALAMMNGGFPPMVPDMNMLLSMGIPPGMAMPPGMRPPARMMPMEPSFAQLGPLTVDRQPHDLSFRRNNILTGDPQNEIPNHLRPPSVAGGKRVRCQFWPACTKGSNCQYFHPTRTCTAYPNCPKSGNTCNFIHPVDNPNEAHPPKEPGESLNRVENGHQPISPQSHWQTTQQMPFHPNLLASSVVGNKIPCKFGHACNKPGCPFFHQKQVGSSAPPCKFYPNCTNMSCPFTHPGSNSSKFSSYGEPLAAATSEDVEMEDTSTSKPSLQELLDRPLSDGPKTSTRSSIPFKKVPIPCRESAACARPGCHFTHPWDKPEPSNVPCRFGPACTRPGCSFQHPRHQNRSATFNKPASEHVSERNFSLSEVQEQILPGGSSIESGEVKSNGAMEVS